MSLTVAGATALAAGLSAAGEVASGAAQGRSNRLTREFNAQQASIAFERQKELRGTNYQATVKDMKAAGLNPMMMYGSGGESTAPGVPTASVGNQQAPRIDVGKTVSSAIEAAMYKRQQGILDEQLSNLQMDVYNKAKDMDVKDSLIAANLANAGLTGENARRLKYGWDTWRAENDVAGLKSKADRDKHFWAIDYLANKGRNVGGDPGALVGGLSAMGSIDLNFALKKLADELNSKPVSQAEQKRRNEDWASQAQGGGKFRHKNNQPSFIKKDQGATGSW